MLKMLIQKVQTDTAEELNEKLGKKVVSTSSVK